MAEERLLLAGFLGLLLTSLVTSDPICLPAPPWQVDGVAPMEQSLGRVTALSLLQASWSSCVDQAANLEQLRQKFLRHGFEEVIFMGVNSKQWHSELMVQYLEERVQFPVYQAATGNDVFQTLNGRKDDVYVYDRCGRLAYYIPFPKSYTRYGFVESAILSSLLDEPCGPCNRTESPSSPSNHTQPPPQEVNRDPCDTEASIPSVNNNETSSVVLPASDSSLHKQCSWRALGQQQFAGVVQRLREECVAYSFNRWKNRTRKKRQHRCCVLARDLLEDKCLFTMLSEQNRENSLYQCRCMVSPLDSERNCVCHESTESFTYMVPHRSCMCENMQEEALRSWDCAPGTPDEPQSCAWRLSQHVLETSCFCRPDFPCSSISTHSWSCEDDVQASVTSLAVSDASARETNVLEVPPEQSSVDIAPPDTLSAPVSQSWQCQWPDASPLMQLNQLQCSGSHVILTPPPSCTCCQTSDGINCKCSNHTQVTAVSECSCEGHGKSCGTGTCECRWQDAAVSVCGDKCEAATRAALQTLTAQAETTWSCQDLEGALWECQEGGSSCSWDLAAAKSAWQWAGGELVAGSPWNWQTGDLTSDTSWQCPSSDLPLGTFCQWQQSDINGNISWQCQGPKLASGTSWEWHDSQPLEQSPSESSDCQWQSEGESAVMSATWQCQGSLDEMRSCEWQETARSVATSDWSWQHSNVSDNVLWQCPNSVLLDETVWECDHSTSSDITSWRCVNSESVSNTPDWQCPSETTVTSDLTWQWRSDDVSQTGDVSQSDDAPVPNLSPWQWQEGESSWQWHTV